MNIYSITNKLFDVVGSCTGIKVVKDAIGTQSTGFTFVNGTNGHVDVCTGHSPESGNPFITFSFWCNPENEIKVDFDGDFMILSLSDVTEDESFTEFYRTSTDNVEDVVSFILIFLCSWGVSGIPTFVRVKGEVEKGITVELTNYVKEGTPYTRENLLTTKNALQWAVDAKITELL